MIHYLLHSNLAMYELARYGTIGALALMVAARRLRERLPRVRRRRAAEEAARAERIRMLAEKYPLPWRGRP